MEWISVKERLPDEGQMVLIASHCPYVDNDEVTICHAQYSESGYFDDFGFTFNEQVTHWMPLPNPPAA